VRQLELLSPAKNLECGISAISHGADAVYIGARKYGARAAAGNSIEDIAELCRYAHQYDAKVYATVNTIIYDDEMSDTLTLCHDLKKAGVDALLIQDMGLLTHNPYPALHASTQTDNRTAEKVRWLADLGFKRVVLARELSIKEIAAIHEAVPDVELEVFVHGALCVSYSGQCYASHHCFGRSANRGECAQLCRMPMTLKDAEGRVIEQGKHLLSLKDLSQLENLERLAEAGAVSFKIEGRLKDAEYVKNVTAAYSEALNRLCHLYPQRYRRASMGHCTYTFKPDINKSFNRGFTTYFATANKLPDDREPMASFFTPKAMGEFVGKVKEIKNHCFSVASLAAFCNGDGLCYIMDGKLIGFRINKVEGNRLYPLTMPVGLRPGLKLYRNHDQAFLSVLSKPSAQRKIDISMELQLSTEPSVSMLQLIVTDEHGHQGSANIECGNQIAQKPQEENIKRQLLRLGDTPYECVSIDMPDHLPFIPSSLLSQLRRNAIQALSLNVNGDNCGNDNGNEGNHEAHADVAHEAPVPHYDSEELYNAANRDSKEFYRRYGIDAKAFEQDGGAVVMQCRYCLRHELGYCTKQGKKASWKEPLTISIDNGKTFQLHFDCKKCEMTVNTI
jgi:putative protease